MKLNKIMFSSMIVTGTTITISSNSWFMMWMGLEIALMSSIPIFSEPLNPLSTEASMKYFITQAIASSVMMMSLVTMNMWTNTMMMEKTAMSSILNSMMMLKMGAAPLHFWFPEVMEGLSWKNCMIMLTILKMAPLSIMINSMQNHIIMMVFIVSSALISPIMSLNQSSMRKIMTYSSINHMAWMIASSEVSISSMYTYFLAYTILTISMSMMMEWSKTSFMNQLNFNNRSINMMLTINMISMSGLPPMMGFLPKWIAMYSMIKSSMTMLPLMLIVSSLIMSFVYIRTMMPSMLLNQSTMKTFKKKKSSNIYWTMLLSNLSLPIVTMIMNPL